MFSTQTEPEALSRLRLTKKYKSEEQLMAKSQDPASAKLMKELTLWQVTCTKTLLTRKFGPSQRV